MMKHLPVGATNVRKESGRSTISYSTPEYDYVLRYHFTDVFKRKGNTVELNSGGLKTTTTKARLNSCLAKTPGAFIWQEKGIWYYSGTEFFDGMKINTETGEFLNSQDSGESQRTRKKRIDKLIKQMESRILEGEIPLPALGDCLLCQLRAQNPGMRADCMELHLEEGYLHGSLLLCVAEWQNMDDLLRAALWDTSQDYGHWRSLAIKRLAKAFRRYARRECGLVS